MISLGFLVATRFTSEELANGIINLVSWPMMLLSAVWYSLEGAQKWLRIASEALASTPSSPWPAPAPAGAPIRATLPDSHPARKQENFQWLK